MATNDGRTVKRTEFEVVERTVENAVCQWCGDEQPAEDMHDAVLDPELTASDPALSMDLYDRLAEMAARHERNHDLIDAEVDRVEYFSADISNPVQAKTSVHYDYDPSEVTITAEQAQKLVHDMLLEYVSVGRGMYLCDYCADVVFDGEFGG